MHSGSLTAISLIITALLVGAPSPIEAREKQTKRDKDERAFIEQTRIYAPKRVGDWVLESVNYDPAEKHAGAAFRYAHVDQPQIRFDFYIYPAGDMPDADAMQRGMKDFMDSFDAAVKLDYYRDLTVIGRHPFQIGLQKSPVKHSDDASAGTQIADEKPASEASADPQNTQEKAIDTALTPKLLHGERVDLKYTMNIREIGEAVPMRSRGYLFYKQLYYFKGRVSTAVSGMDQSEFEAFSDLAVEKIVPAIRAANIGGCVDAAITISAGDAEKNEDAIMQQILNGFSKKIGRSCFDSPADAERTLYPDGTADHELVTIDYDPEDWGSQ